MVHELNLFYYTEPEDNSKDNYIFYIAIYNIITMANEYIRCLNYLKKKY